MILHSAATAGVIAALWLALFVASLFGFEGHYWAASLTAACGWGIVFVYRLERR